MSYFGRPKYSFPSFTLLPPELRQMIWDEALRKEASDRFVVITRAQVHGSAVAVAPVKHLISPFLSATRESRARAQVFYDVKVEMQAFETDEPVAFSELTWTLENEIGQFPPQREVQLTKEALRREPRSKGAIYISPKHDKFVAASCSPPAPDCDEMEAKIMLWGFGGYGHGQSRSTTQYIFAPLGVDTTAHIPTLTLAWKSTRDTELVFDYRWFTAGYFKRESEFGYFDLDKGIETGFLNRSVSPWGLRLRRLITFRSKGG
ncbi:hypothetical protein SLS62_000472 [Diatrype stigma]|uniref:2EXR domain-containing protein n=1 Tax=Diatrype stigma TaxID=117547 RepID=A0AAN9YWR0_9PEZI